MTRTADFITAPRLTRFRVIGLHNDRNIQIEFGQSVKVILAENGVGKTTTLNLLIAALTGDFARITHLEFSALEVTFASGEGFSITKSDVPLFQLDVDVSRNPRLLEVKRMYSDATFQDLLGLAATRSISELMVNSLFREADTAYPGSSSSFAEELQQIAAGNRRTDDEKRRVSDIRKIISRNFGYRIVYLPTYRRIEEDLRLLGLELPRPAFRRLDTTGLINFGMRDVTEKIRSLTAEIRDSSIKWYQTTSAQMLTDLAGESISSQANKKRSLIESADLRLMLGRLRSIVSEETTQRILRYVKSGELFEPRRESLALFLGNLIEIYEKTRARDEQVKAFMTTVNDYLVDKEFRYDELNVVLELFSRRSGSKMPLESLSSGEKQLISILSRVYLEQEDRCAVFFDEPELSLSLEWQKKLLPDILRSNRCGFLLALSHSPFIFANDLDAYVEPLNVDYLKPILPSGIDARGQ